MEREQSKQTGVTRKRTRGKMWVKRNERERERGEGGEKQNNHNNDSMTVEQR